MTMFLEEKRVRGFIGQNLRGVLSITVSPRNGGLIVG